MNSSRERRYCCVYGCLNTNSADISFFTLPSDKERRWQWLRLISREDLADRNNVSHRVCEVHFKDSDIMLNATRKSLKKNSLPYLYLPNSTIENTKTDASIQAVINVGDNFPQTKSELLFTYTPNEITQNNTAVFQVCEPSTSFETEYLNHFSKASLATESTSISENVHVINIKHEDLEVEMAQPSLECLQSQSTMETVTSGLVYPGIKIEPLVRSENDLFDQSDEEIALKPVCNTPTLTLSPLEVIDIPPDPMVASDKVLIPPSAPSLCTTSTQTNVGTRAVKDLTLQRFLPLCDKFLTPKFAKLVKMQAQFKTQSKKKGNRYTEEFKSYCEKLRQTCPEAYPFLEDLLCLPCGRTMQKFRNKPKTVEGSGNQSKETNLNDQHPCTSFEGIPPSLTVAVSKEEQNTLPT